MPSFGLCFFRLATQAEDCLFCAWPFSIPVSMINRSPDCPVVLSRGVNSPLQFPVYPCMHMPCSSTPVVSTVFAITHSEFMPSSATKLSAFTVTITVYLYFPYRPQLPSFRSSVTRPAHSLRLALNTPYWICSQVHYRQAGFTCQVGIEQYSVLTHWVKLISFSLSFSIPIFWI